MTDKNSNGLPDVSLPREIAMVLRGRKPDTGMGCMYAGKNEAWYFAYNMNSVRETFALPRLPENGVWEVYLDTAEFWGKGPDSGRRRNSGGRPQHCLYCMERPENKRIFIARMAVIQSV